MALSWVCRIGGTLDPQAQLTQAEQDNNMQCVYGALKQYGWTDEAIAGAIGCFHEESHMNPGIYETGHGGNLNNLPYFPGGMGLAQWTDYKPYTATYPNPLPWSADREGQDWWNGNFQCWLMTKANDSTYTSMGYGQGPRWGWLQSSRYPSIAWDNYLHFTGTPEQATVYWFYDYEWHWDEVPSGYIEARQQWARYAYDLIHGLDPEVPEGGGGGGGGGEGDLPGEYYLYAVLASVKGRRKRDGKYQRLRYSRSV